MKKPPLKRKLQVESLQFDADDWFYSMPLAKQQGIILPLYMKAKKIKTSEVDW